MLGIRLEVGWVSAQTDLLAGHIEAEIEKRVHIWKSIQPRMYTEKHFIVVLFSTLEQR